MSLTPEQQEQLTNEQFRGGKAKRAYKEFIQDFVESKRALLFDSFCNLPLTDTENLMEVKRMLYAVDQLDIEIRTVIETGEMASLTLNQEEVKH